MSRYKNCFLCDVRLQNAQIHNTDQLFYVAPQASNQEPNKSYASILGGVLEQEIVESNAHSKILCKKCQQNCTEFDSITKRLDELRQTITDDFNNTMSRYAMKFVEIDTENDESNANMYKIETVNQKMGEVFETTNNVKKVMLIKSEDDSNSFYTISDMHDDQSMHTMFINDESEFGAANDIGEQYIIAGDDCVEKYFEGSDDPNDDDDDDDDIDSNQYQNVIEENSGDTMPDNFDMDQENEDDNIIVIAQDIKTRSKKKSDAEQRQLFIRNGMQFHCLLCQPTTDVVYDTKTISIHLKTDHNERIYVCSICGTDFQKRNSYNDHVNNHMDASPFQCEICKVDFDDARKFRMHKKTHNPSEKIWSCNACDKKYNSKNLLDEHMNMHTGERPYKCPHCVKDFASKYTLTAHMKIHSDRQRPFECKDCGKSFFSNQNLMQHARTHTGVKEYECDVCNKKFGSPHNLDVHKIVHTGHKPFICRTCGKAFARRAEIKDHERTHTGERPYKCDMCSSSFAQRSNLMSHKRATHFNDKRYKCETCNRSFKRRRLLEYHIKATHTGERPYKCSQCNSTFVYPEHYKKHMRIHTGVKPFACEVCGKTFNSRDNRNAHRYVHSDKKPYECLVCHQGFMRRPLLYAHMEASNHLNDKIIINKPRIPVKKETLDTDQSTEENEEIVYLNLNDEDLLDEDEYAILEEEHIVDDDETTDDNLTTDMKDTVTFIDTSETENTLSLEPICENDDGQWIEMTS